MLILVILLASTLSIHARSSRSINRTQRTVQSLRDNAHVLPGVLAEQEETVATMLKEIQEALYEIDTALDAPLTPHLQVLLHRLLSSYNYVGTHITSFDHIDAEQQQEILKSLMTDLQRSSHRTVSNSLNAQTLLSVEKATQHLSALLNPTLYRRASTWKQITRSNSPRANTTRDAAYMAGLTTAALLALKAVQPSEAPGREKPPRDDRSSDSPSHASSQTAHSRQPDPLPRVVTTKAQLRRGKRKDLDVTIPPSPRRTHGTPSPDWAGQSSPLPAPPTPLVTTPGPQQLDHYTQLKQWHGCEMSDFDIAGAMGTTEKEAYRIFKTYIRRMNGIFKEDLRKAHHNYRRPCICAGSNPPLVKAYYATMPITALDAIKLPEDTRVYPLYRLAYISHILSEHALNTFREKGGSHITRKTTWGTPHHADALNRALTKQQPFVTAILNLAQLHTQLAEKPGVYCDDIKAVLAEHTQLCLQASQLPQPPSADSFPLIPSLEDRLIIFIKLRDANTRLRDLVIKKANLSGGNWFNQHEVEKALASPTHDAGSLIATLKRVQENSPSSDPVPPADQVNPMLLHRLALEQGKARE